MPERQTNGTPTPQGRQREDSPSLAFMLGCYDIWSATPVNEPCADRATAPASTLREAMPG